MSVIDRKFQIQAVNPVNGNRYTEADGFFVCAKDVSAPDAVEGLIKGSIEARSNHEHIESLKLLRERVVQFQADMGGGRTPDTIGAEIPRCLNGEGVEERKVEVRIDYSFLLAEIDKEGAKAEERIAGEKLSGNAVKQAHAEGEFIALNVMRSWIKRLMDRG